MKENNGKVKPFGMKDRLGYMFGDFGNDFTFILSTMFFSSLYAGAITEMEGNFSNESNDL